MRGLLIWLTGLLRPENLRAARASLARRLRGRDFLEMRRTLGEDVAPGRPAGTIVVESFTPPLAGECLLLLNATASLGFWHRSRFSREILGRVADPGDILVVRDAGGVAGMTVLHAPAPGGEAEIGYVAVHPRLRGRGCGRLLVERALALARSRSIPWVFLRTDAFRLPAIRTYLAAGFEPHPRGPEEGALWERTLRLLGAASAGRGALEKRAGRR